MGYEFQYGDSGKRMAWPHSTPREDRLFQPGVRGFFSYLRDSKKDPPFFSQLIKVKGHALVCPIAGAVVAGKGRDEVICRPTQAMLFTDTTAVITEQSNLKGLAKSRWYFLNESSMAKILYGDYIMLERFSMFLDYPLSEKEVFIREVFKDPIAAQRKDIFQVVRSIIVSAYGQLNGPLLKLAFKRYIVPRIKILLFLERLIPLPEVLRAQYLEAYPGGVRALRRDMTRLNMPTVSKCLEQRLKEMGVLREILKFGPRQEPPEALFTEEPVDSFTDEASPGTGVEEKGIPQISLTSAMGRWVQDVSQLPSAEYKKQFEDGENTGILNIVSAETLDRVAELSDWKDSLKLNRRC
jgi:hypothetical protein